MDTKSLLKLLVETESPSHEKAAVDRVGAIVVDEARKLGAAVEIIPNAVTGDHVIARWGADAKRKPILLVCHMDTVFPLGTLKKFPYSEAEGKIMGPGVSDMKASIAISLGAIEDARQNGTTRPITLLCTSDEEIGSDTSRELIQRLAKESELVLVMEPALIDGSLKTWRKGGGGFHVKVKGRAAHAGGDHEKGRNAIEEMAHQVIAIQKMTDYEKKTTLNVGVISGGTVSNVVPDEANIDVDVRILQPGEWERLEALMKELKPVLDGTSIEVTGSLNRGPMPFDELMQATFGKAKTIAAEIGVDLKAGGTGGVSDANLVAPFGIPVLDGLGAIGENYHSEREYIFAGSLAQRVKLISAFLKNW
ncbi:MAG: M20 family metallopeptidase [Anaerolineales bacterium]|uniref:M20 family metallopeptidase n=1 Tax=Candidatus Villigracilis vicinus TaxID=3140679 RepID=UPI00313624C7|nr:M20 family metallopeptidase [Anaerolineales bacterium]MBK7448306.1 M20 family metallopeptidase [Anaerolineales bacterium]MBK9780924.1 M20 family metallopeptidase [Anaerolineales bacterium]